MIGRLCAPSDPARPWWWQSSTKSGGRDITVGGMAPTESDAILAAATTAIELRLGSEPAAPVIPGFFVDPK